MHTSPLPQNTHQQRERARVRVTGADKRAGHPNNQQRNPAQPLLIHNNKIPKIRPIPKIPVQTTLDNTPQHMFQ